jgi:hypothetical protein
MLQEVRIRIQHSMLDVVSVQDRSDLREQLQLVKSGLSSLTSLVVSLACLFHLHLEIGQQIVDLVLQILRRAG